MTRSREEQAMQKVELKFPFYNGLSNLSRNDFATCTLLNGIQSSRHRKSRRNHLDSSPSQVNLPRSKSESTTLP